MDTLIALGSGSAYLYSLFSGAGEGSYYEVAAFLISFILFGRYLEAITKKKVSTAIRKLAGLNPRSAIIVRDGVETGVLIEDLSAGDVVVVKPGERIACDGVVTEGYSSIDESLLTGESMPVEKKTGDKVIGGTINISGAFKFKAVRVGRETMLSGIIRLVEEAQGSKAPIQELADRVAGIFVPSVLVIALAAFFIWYVLLAKGFAFALGVFISVLIIACPCAMGLATPTAVMMGSAIAAGCGIIIKNAAALEEAGKVKAIIFDKTGTLTRGRPIVAGITAYGHAEKEVLRLAGSLGNKSEHPLAEAIVRRALSEGIALEDAREFKALPGKGIRAKLGDTKILLGNIRLMEEEGVDIAFAGKELAAQEEGGRTVMMLACGGKLAGMISVRDELKDFSHQTIERLIRSGKDVFMLTGDNKRVAGALARELGINRVLAEVMPEGKADQIRKLQRDGLKVAFVGDGINDAPALAQADLGIATGTGTDIALEAGDMILVKDDLRDISTAIDISRFTMRKIKQNLFWAFFYNVVGIPVAAGVLYPAFGLLLNPLVAAIAMVFSSLSVVANSISMRGYRPKRYTAV
jgi:Cu+-exporting ATPase